MTTTRDDFMTPVQSKQAAAIMLKHGEDGWRIQLMGWWEGEQWATSFENIKWNWLDWNYRAIRIERIPTRTPLPIDHYKRGMGVATDRLEYIALGYYTHASIKVHSLSNSLENLNIGSITKWRWPNEIEWKPAYTETVEEREVERLEVEGL